MTIGELNAAIAKAKGWECTQYTSPGLIWREPKTRYCHAHPTDSDAECFKLLEEIPFACVNRRADGWECYHDEHIGPVIRYDSLHEAICRAWFEVFG